MTIGQLPANGLDALRAEWGTGNRKAPHPPVVLTAEGPVAVYYLSEVRALPPDTVVVWSWPGTWRNDVFQTTVGELLGSGIAANG